MYVLDSSYAIAKMHAANNGYFVFLDTEEYHYSPYAGYEFKKADELNANTILIALTDEADRCCSNDPSLGRYRHISLGHIPIENKADEVTNTILMTATTLLPMSSGGNVMNSDGGGVPIDLHRAINEYTYALHNCGRTIKINGIWLDEYVKILHEKIHAH